MARVTLFSSESNSNFLSYISDINTTQPLISNTIYPTDASRNPESILADLLYRFRQSTQSENTERAGTLFVAIVGEIRKLHDQIDPFQMVFKNRSLKEEDIDAAFQKLIHQTRKYTSDIHDMHLRIFIGYAEFLLHANTLAGEADEVLTESFRGRLQKVRSILKDLLRYMPSLKAAEFLESIMDAKATLEKEEVWPNQGGKDFDMGLFEAMVLLCAQQPVYSHAIPLFVQYLEQRLASEIAAMLEGLCEMGCMEKIPVRIIPSSIVIVAVDSTNPLS